MLYFTSAILLFVFASTIAGLSFISKNKTVIIMSCLIFAAGIVMSSFSANLRINELAGLFHNSGFLKNLSLILTAESMAALMILITCTDKIKNGKAGRIQTALVSFPPLLFPVWICTIQFIALNSIQGMNQNLVSVVVTFPAAAAIAFMVLLVRKKLNIETLIDIRLICIVLQFIFAVFIPVTTCSSVPGTSGKISILNTLVTLCAFALFAVCGFLINRINHKGEKA